MEYPNLWHSSVLLASQQQKFRRSATLKKEHIKSLKKLLGQKFVRSIATVIIRKVFTNGQQVQKSLQFLDLVGLLKSYAFHFNCRSGQVATTTTTTTEQITKLLVEILHLDTKCQKPAYPSPAPQELGVKIAEGGRTFAELPINVNANCQPISWPVRSVLMFINWPAMAQLSVLSLSLSVSREDDSSARHATQLM